MRGVIISLLWDWDGQIFHNNKGDPEKDLRYAIGVSRYAFLRRNLSPFACKDIVEPDGTTTQEVAYLVELDDGDKDPRMPSVVRFEYLAGHKKAGGSFLIFSYIWFSSISEAKQYVLSKHRMSILPGW